MSPEKSYKEQVEARIAAEPLPEQPGNNDSEITSEFVMQCLDANELGDGMLYAALHHDRYIFVKNLQEWFVWKGHYWEPDDYNRAVADVEDVALRFAAEIEILGGRLSVALADPSDEAKPEQIRLKSWMGKLHKRINKLRSEKGRQSCLKFAHTNPVNPLAVHYREFNKNPWLLACLNGVVDLKTGKFNPGKRSDYMSKHCNVEWDGLNADQDAWVKVLEGIFEHKVEKNIQDMISFNRRLYGYGITGLPHEHVFAVHHGGGRNGKGLMFDMFMKVLGDYAGPIPSEMLLDTTRGAAGNQTAPELLAMNGLRLAIASETDEGRKFSAAKVKWLTGGDKLTARGLYDKKPTRFDPSHLLCLLTNNKPAAPGTDSAFWDRCMLIHHRIKFVKYKPELPNERPADKMLYESLIKCGPGILAWLVQGCLEWQQQGLNPPEIITRATDEYREDENYIGQFLTVCCELGEDQRCSAKELYAAFKIFYREHINENDRFIPSKTRFGKMLMATELFKKKRPGGIIKYFGLHLNSEMVNRIMSSDGDI